MIKNLLNKFIEKRESIVNLKSGTSFRCVIWQHKGDYVVLKSASLLSDETGHMEPVKIDGEVIIKQVDIDFIQVVT